MMGFCVCAEEKCWCMDPVEIPPGIVRAIENNEDYFLPCPKCANGLHVLNAVTATCPTCRQIRAEGGYGPPHYASPRCESGGHNHCTCDTCF